MEPNYTPDGNPTQWNPEPPRNYYDPNDPKNKINGKGIASLIVACLSILCCFSWQISIVLGTVAIILGVMGMRDANKKYEDTAIAGIVVGAVAVALGVCIAIMTIYMSATIQVPAPGKEVPAQSSPAPDTSLPEGADEVMMAVRNAVNW